MTDPINQTGTMNAAEITGAVGANSRTAKAESPKAAEQPSVETASVQAVPQAGDSVEISVPAHVRLLKQQGLSADEIAFRLRLDIQTVNQYLGPNPL